MAIKPLDTEEVTYPRLTRFFIPLALQGISQSLTYPLVAMVASRGEGGTVNLAGFTQACVVMFFLMTAGASLLTAGMVYIRSREGLAVCVRANSLVMAASVGLHALLAIPVLSHTVFGTIMGLPPSIEQPARQAFVALIPLQALLFLRNPYQATLFVHKATGRAYVATVVRILSTLGISAGFSALGYGGPINAAICLTAPLVVEVGLYVVLTRRYLRRLPDTQGEFVTLGRVLLFSATLSVGGIFLAFSSFLVASFIARAPKPEIMLAVFALATGIANPCAHGATRVRELVISFIDPENTDPKLFRFAFFASLILGAIPLAFILPPLDRAYYVVVQKLDPAHLPVLKATALALVLHPLSLGLRSYYVGVAAAIERPTIILAAQAAYLGIVAVTCFLTLYLGVSGNLIGAAALLFGNLASLGVVRLGLYWDTVRNRSAPPSGVELGGG